MALIRNGQRRCKMALHNKKMSLTTIEASPVPPVSTNARKPTSSLQASSFLRAAHRMVPTYNKMPDDERKLNSYS
jgi:hypothetical protein